MKKIFFLCAIALSSCGIFQKVPTIYQNQTVCLWTKPVNIAPEKIIDEKTYLIEGYKPEGIPVLVFVKGDLLRKTLGLTWDEGEKRIGATIEGNIFTCNFLAQGSILSRKDIESGRYDMQQLETLYRDRNVEKYELRSFLPLKGTGKIEQTGNSYRIRLSIDQNKIDQQPKKKSAWDDL